MTVGQSLRKRARLLAAGAVSFALALAVTRWGAGTPLVQPQSDVGVLIGFALVALYFVLQDTRTGPDAGHVSKTGLN
ncbi:MAG: hypothetical protein KGM42_18530 [Hyphomicrobiales bacterium]|nr:hypothetical protein [Hyphomicrobiales bacterium]